MGLPGSELYWDKTLGLFSRIYCGLFGAPIVGLRIRLRRIKKLWPDKASNILDAGCGRGIISREMARTYKSTHITALDANQDVQDRNTLLARKMGLSNCEFIVADVTQYKSESAFDFILSVDNLEHVKEDEQVLQNFFMSMKPGGVLVVHVPHFYRRWPVFKWTENFDVPEHVRPGYHLAEIKERVERAGFVISKEGFGYGFIENLMNNLSYMITGAREKRKLLYALLFPFINLFAWFGQFSHPKFGASVYIIAEKPPL